MIEKFCILVARSLNLDIGGETGGSLLLSRMSGAPLVYGYLCVLIIACFCFRRGEGVMENTG